MSASAVLEKAQEKIRGEGYEVDLSVQYPSIPSRASWVVILKREGEKKPKSLSFTGCGDIQIEGVLGWLEGNGVIDVEPVKSAMEKLRTKVEAA